MLHKLSEKIRTTRHHHQVVVVLLVGFGIVCASWGVEGILEDYIFVSKSLAEYITAIISGLVLLWLAKHYIARIM
jgi:hypothetical protein